MPEGVVRSKLLALNRKNYRDSYNRYKRQYVQQHGYERINHRGLALVLFSTLADGESR